MPNRYATLGLWPLVGMFGFCSQVEFFNGRTKTLTKTAQFKPPLFSSKSLKKRNLTENDSFLSFSIKIFSIKTLDFIGVFYVLATI